MRFYSPSNPSTIASLLATHDSYFATGAGRGHVSDFSPDFADERSG
ncbi:Uncharacterised protein [Vibrio cholerae]|nr:Uncharacterised protein [Vibrio cholerae]